MATLEQIVYNIAENVNKEHDMPFIERLRFMVPYYRALFLRRDEAKGRRIDQHFLQTLEEVEMEEVENMIEAIADIECPLLRSKFKIPQLVRLLSGPAIQAVTTMDGNRIIQPIQFEAIRTIGYGRYTGHEPRYYYRKGYLWLLKFHAESVSLEGVAEDPYEFELFNDPAADIRDMQYPVSLDFVQAITETLLKTELRVGNADPTSDDIVVNE